MDFTQVAAFAAVALLLVVSPGPNGVLIARTVPTSGRAAGFANVAGFVAAFYLHGTLSILGISVILMQSAQAFLVVKLIGALYLIWIGVKALVSACRGDKPAVPVSPAAAKSSLLKAFAEGFLTNALNPKVSMFYLAAFPQFIPVEQGTVMSAYLLVSVHSIINMIWFAGLVILFSRLVSVAKHDSFQRILKGVTGAIFIGFGARLATLKVQ